MLKLLKLLKLLTLLTTTKKRRVARSWLKPRLATRLGATLEEKSIEEKLASVGLTLSQVVNYVLKQTNKELDTSFNPVDDSMKPYRFKKK